MYATFDKFKKLAIDDSLNTNEKVGFSDNYRKETEKNIFPDILEKLAIHGGGKAIMDIGCGCSKPVLMLIDFARKNNHTLYLVDSKEMLDNLPDESFINKVYCEFPRCEVIQNLKNKMNYIIVYSVLHHIVMHANYINFIDSIIELLSNGGKALIADLPNSTKKKRFLSSGEGVKFHQNWSQDSSVPKVSWNELEKNLIDDSLLFSVLQRYRNMGCETYLLEQKDGLPMNKTREDILIKRN